MIEQTLIHSIKLTDFEYSILKSCALGLGDFEIKRLLILDDNSFKEIKKSLFKKLGVQNTYCAVIRSYELGFLSAVNYTEESIKAETLRFFEKRIQIFQAVSQENDEALWECYDLLLEYRVELNEVKEKQAQKKSHRSGIKDFSPTA